MPDEARDQTSKLVSRLLQFAADSSQIEPEEVQTIALASLLDTSDLQQISRFFETISAGKSECLVFDDLQLYFHSWEEGFVTIRFLERAGYTVIQRSASDENMERVREMERMVDLIINLERGSRLSALQIGKKASLVSAGKRGGNPPYGTGANEALILERIRKEKEGGMGPTEIANGLNADGVPARRGKRWYPSAIANIIGSRGLRRSSGSVKAG